MVLSVVVALAIVVLGSSAHAAYNSNNIIDDGRFVNHNTMDQAAIQAFLSARGSYLAGYTDPQVNQPAAQIIREAALDFGLNPQVIMATLQKEQSLITNPSPSASNIRSAMGYGCPTTGFCDPSLAGFYNQVRNGSWQLRFNYERSGGNNGTWAGPSGAVWGNPSILYPCRNATSLYSTGLMAGRQVTFYAHTNGQAYATITVTNRATAAMYCYTPHVYNPSGVPVYYSGSYNFVTFYERWFGPTQGEPYAWSYAGQSSSSGGSMPATQKATWTVYAQNTGTATWSNTGANPIRLGTSNSRDRASAFCDVSWPSCNRAATLNESSVAPGQTGSFTFTVQAPGTGTFNEYFNLVAEGAMWLNDPGLYFGVNVTTPNLSGTVIGNTLPTAMTAGAASSGVLSIRNDGNATWYKAGRFPMSLGTSSPTDRTSKFYSPSWSSSTRVALMNEASVAPGQTATFTVPLKAPAYNGSYTEAFSRVVDGFTWTPQIISQAISVTGGQAPPTNSLGLNQSLDPNQILRSADGRFALILQGDGNLVLYSPRRALWSTGTTGRNPGAAILQGDGNFVAYDAQGRAYWATWTQGNPGTALVVQDDGNVVIYNAQGRPLWNTRTAGQL